MADFKDTLNLPQTSFPMRASLAQREPERLSRWEQDKLYERVIAEHASDTPFVLHDGPPYANGNIHMGHTLNKVLKDLILRFQSMAGHRCDYVPGWDCHGLPIEQQVLKQVGDKIHDMEPLELRKLCHNFAMKWVDTQRDQFKRLGILGQWEDPYLTTNPQYEVGILQVLEALVQKSLIYKGFKTVSWDPVFRTALAEAEIEYEEHESPSIYVAMPLKNASAYPSLAAAGVTEASFVIWTTTPWTMPANLGISLHPEFDYIALQAGEQTYLIAEGLREAFEKACKLEDTTVRAKFKATEFDRALAQHPIFDDKDSLVMLGEHVTLEQGTGCVHTAPGHGADDFIIGRAYGLPVFCPVDAKGCYTNEYPAMEGTFVFDANPKVVDLLREKGLLVGYRKIKHDYPYSWRSKQPIIFRATEQWFVDLSSQIRDRALKAIDEEVEWIPAWGRDRIRGMVERRPEWCISRQRHWGVPIPALRQKSTNSSVLDAAVVAKFIALVADKGTDAWYSEPLESFLPEGWDANDFEKEFDILDVWFDSGASHTAVLKPRDNQSYPADLYLEGSDQHRGWFQSSLLLGVGAHDSAPFKAVLTHGFVLDGKGVAMSKSMGNVISPLDLIEKYGADILRLWVASTDYRNDVALSEEIVKITADTYRTIRNSLRFQLGNLYDFDVAKDAVALDDLLPLDRWALHELATLVEDVTKAFASYEFHRGYQYINRYFVVTLSSRYHDFLKDRLYTMRADGLERRSAQTVIYHHFVTLTKLLAPVLVFTCDEAWSQGTEEIGLPKGSVHLQGYPQAQPEWKNPQLAEDFERLLTIRDQVNERLEALRTAKVIGKSTDAAVELKGPAQDADLSVLQRYESSLPELFVVSRVLLGTDEAAEALQIEAREAEGERCPRCWRRVDELIHTEAGDVCPRCAEAIVG
ncbi:MAG: isoleucine--tRNA ligase [Verrucomicrobiota bacterium JB022]|nr:isoleucine--tRNA ligase [Verrucomicrobiota bacterium JB022]